MPGIILPTSMYPSSPSRTFPNIHVGAGANGAVEDQGLGVIASLDADASWNLRFMLPPSLPAGTAKLRLLALANATTGNAQVNPAWAAIAVESDPSTVGLTGEGTTTVSWTTGKNDVYRETKITLDADTIAGGDIIIMKLQFLTTSWTLAVTSTWIPMIIWE